MTTRGGGAGGVRPQQTSNIPIDTSLTTRPVPRRRNFDTRAFGPGSATDLQTQPFRELDQATDRSTYSGPGEYLETDDIRRLLEEVDTWAECQFREDRDPEPVDRTWGYYVFLTDYSSKTQELLPRAMENWVRVIDRKLQAAETLPALCDEARRRFKLELVQDEAEFANASDDRVRENFRAFLRHQDLTEREDLFPPQARYSLCFALNAAAVEMLADLQFLDEPLQEYKAFRSKTVKMIDAYWDRTRLTSSPSGYHGIGQLAINGLARLYMIITSDSNDRAMEDLHPINGFPR